MITAFLATRLGSGLDLGALAHAQPIMPSLDVEYFGTHALIEFGNGAISGLVGMLTVAAAVLAFTRRPYRRDLEWLAVSLPLFVVAQACAEGSRCASTWPRAS